MAVAACGGGTSGPPTPTPEPTPSPSPSPTPTATATPTPTVAPTPTATPDPRPVAPSDQPIGFPLDESTRTGRVVGEVGSRTIAWGEGPAAGRYTREDQPSDDPVRANACGWNARVHLEYEAQPAVDWYIPTGTPIVATMDGTATLLVNTVSNPFDYYGVSREPYIGNPDRARAPISPFPGPGGGQGAFVRVQNGGFRTDYAHFELMQTLTAVPDGAFLSGYSRGTDYASLFAPIRDFRTATAIARWEVRKGDVIGFSGDSGYSEAPHLHYTVAYAGAGYLLCPTDEPGFNDRGWLLPELRGYRP